MLNLWRSDRSKFGLVEVTDPSLYADRTGGRDDLSDALTTNLGSRPQRYGWVELKAPAAPAPTPGPKAADVSRAVERGRDDPDPMGLRAAGPPTGVDLATFHTRVARAATDHEQKTGTLIRFDELYQQVGGGMGKRDFARALTHGHDTGAYTLGGWGQSPEEIPDPGLAAVLGEKPYYTVNPGGRGK